MPFLDRLVFKDRKPPARFYVHTAGHREIFGKGKDDSSYLSGAENYAKKILNECSSLFSNQTFLVGFLWGDIERDQKVADVFGFSGLEDSPVWHIDNPSVSSWVFRNGVYAPYEPISCGEGIILLGKEEEARRKTSSLKGYILTTDEIRSSLIIGGDTYYLK